MIGVIVYGLAAWSWYHLPPHTALKAWIFWLAVACVLFGWASSNADDLHRRDPSAWPAWIITMWMLIHTGSLIALAVLALVGILR